MNLKGNLTSKGLQGSIGKSRMQGILGTNPAAIPITVDNALSLSSTNPVQNRVITAAITNRLWSDEVKDAILQIAQKVAYIDADGQDYYDALYAALYPPTNLDSISAVFDSGSTTIYTTDTLDDLKQYLVVTAYYSSGDSEVVDSYTLSGSMDAGAQTITVSYGGKTTTFTVTIIALEVESIDAVFTQSGTIFTTDAIDTLRQYLVVTATYSDSTTAVVTDYTLSGTLEEGTSTITASYEDKTDTFNVTVTAWDYAWDYSMDKLESQDGWYADKSPSGISSSLVSNGEKIVQTSGNKYFQWLVSADGTHSAVRYMTNGYGTIEAIVLGHVPSTSIDPGYIRITAAQNGNVRLAVMENAGKWRIQDSATGANCTSIANYENDTEYKIRIVMKSSTADVYINGVLVSEDISTAVTVSGSSNNIAMRPGYASGSSYYTLLKAVRIKVVSA